MESLRYVADPCLEFGTFSQSGGLGVRVVAWFGPLRVGVMHDR